MNMVNVSVFRDRKYLNCNVWNKSSWTLFKGQRSQKLEETINLDSLEEVEAIDDSFQPIDSAYQKYPFYELEEC